MELQSIILLSDCQIELLNAPDIVCMYNECTLTVMCLIQSQQQAHELDLHRLKVKTQQEAFESQIELENIQQRETQVCYILMSCLKSLNFHELF